MSLNNVYAFWVPISATRVHLVYWMFYPYSQCEAYDCTCSHDGDWEAIIVQLDSGAPTKVAFGNHDTYQNSSWSDVSKVEGDHVLAYSAEGTHGNWPTPGCHYFSEICAPKKSPCSPVYFNGHSGAILYCNGDCDDTTGPFAPNAWDTWNNVEAFDWPLGGNDSTRKCLPGNKEFPGPSLPGWLRKDRLKDETVGTQFANSGPIARWGWNAPSLSPILRSPLEEGICCGLW
jgi:hypothetical protein